MLEGGHIPSEYDQDLNPIQDAYIDIHSMIRSDVDITYDEQDQNIDELDIWYKVEKKRLLSGDLRSARILFEAGLPHLVEP